MRCVSWFGIPFSAATGEDRGWSAATACDAKVGEAIDNPNARNKVRLANGMTMTLAPAT
jgi:hypothetical protein